ncbi:MAG: GNAT family N-acetyltransferase [Clostridiales bacterium]|nr:GNAT family N-acetyltransferase [Clostridiales bacterium]
MTERLDNKDFDEVFSIMEMSFPSDEYRTYNEQRSLLDNREYSVYVLKREDGRLKAFIAVWEFDDFAFIEHFAVNPDCRNEGIGAAMLKELSEKFTGKTLCLEVELPDSEMARRRIGFYNRNNFFINDYPYTQPPISKGKRSIPLCIMTYGGRIDKHQFETIKNVLYKRVYG